MSRPWFPFYVGDYTRDTARLTTEAHGAYLLLMLDYWVNGAPPDDNETLATITKLPLPIWKKRRPLLLPFFRIVEGRWTHGRIERELTAAKEKHQKRVEAGKEGGKARAKAKQNPSNATLENEAMLYQPQPQSEPLPNPDSEKGESNSRSGLKLVSEDAPTPIDETYQPSDRAIEYAYSLGMKQNDLNSELSKFIASSMATRAVSFNPDMSFKVWCDRWLDFKRRKEPDWKPAAAAAETPTVDKSGWQIVCEGTLEHTCWNIYLRETGQRPLFLCKQIREDGSVIDRAAKCITLFPPGFNDFGERVAPQSEDAA